MTSFAPYSHVRRCIGNRKRVKASARRGDYVYAPARGRVHRTAHGVKIVSGNGHEHYLTGVKPRRKALGRKAKPGAHVGYAKRITVKYAHRDPQGRKVDAKKTCKRRNAKPKGFKPWPLGWITARRFYSSGRRHDAYDVGMPIGTLLRAPLPGKVAVVHDGIRNNRQGYNPGSGAPANNVLIHCRTPRGRKVTVYLQHGSPGVLVKPGQLVKAGDPVMRSGNTGNSSGPHLHFAVQKGWQWNAYAHYANPRLTFWTPTRVYRTRS